MTINKNIELKHFDNNDSFIESEKSLIEKTVEATYSSYAPFSKFYVGAGLLLENGEIITGSNQENAAFPSGLCAERVALNAYAHSKLDSKIVALAVTARSEHYKIPQLLSPCGACLQVMSEMVKRQNSDFKLIAFTDENGYYVAEGVASFLPFGFDLA
ncbi:MAG: cytidine deaminase [Bacteroidota bacterium]